MIKNPDDQIVSDYRQKHSVPIPQQGPEAGLGHGLSGAAAPTAGSTRVRWL